MLGKMLNQAQNQIDAKGDRSLTWFFEEKSVADKMRDLFGTGETKRPGIDVEWLPWLGRPK